jgi:DNA-binding transcriptional LysR family regulator
MKIEYLKEFLTLAKTLNFSKAAKAHYLSTSALSKHVSSLENELGIQLFNRTSSAVSLTVNGRLFFEGVESIVNDYENFIKDFTAQILKHRRLLNIYLLSNDQNLMSILAQVRTAFEDVCTLVFNTTNIYAHNYLDLLESDDCDAIICYATEKLNSPHFASVLLESTPFVSIMRKTHPLATKEAISLEHDLVQHRIVRLHGIYFAPGWDTIEQTFYRYGVKPKTASSLIPSVPELVFLNGFEDIFITPQSLAENRLILAGGNYTLIPFEEDVRFNLAINYRKRDESPELEHFITLLKSALTEPSHSTPAHGPRELVDR